MLGFVWVTVLVKVEDTWRMVVTVTVVDASAGRLPDWMSVCLFRCGVLSCEMTWGAKCSRNRSRN